MMEEIDYEYLLNSLANDGPHPQAAADQQRTPTRPPLAIQPTRSGRIPQRPSNTILNPLDFLDFPDESESDDPDFDPLTHPQHSSSNIQSPNTHPLGQQHTLQPPAYGLLNPHTHIDPIGFDFSTLSDQPQPAWPPLDISPFPQASAAAATNNNPSKQFIQPQPAQTAPASPKLSPLTEGEIAGVPFVNINLPDSDDSPEFIPPPTTRSTAAAAATASSSSRPPKRPRRETNSLRPSAGQNLQPSTSSRTLNPPPNPPSKSAKATPQSTFPSTKLPASISGRYIAIAPSPNYLDPSLHPDQKTPEMINNSNDSEDGHSDHSAKIPRQDIAPRAKPGPKPRKSQALGLPGPDHDDELDERADSMKRKREGMRKAREQKKIYIVSLEDRCLELAEENARLREENQELIRESRENWKVKAKSLEVFKLLNQQIQCLQGTSAGGGPASVAGAGHLQQGRPAEHRLAHKRKAAAAPNEDDDDDIQVQPCRPAADPASLSSTAVRRASAIAASSRALPRNLARGRTLLNVLSAKPRPN